jgi:hypothetical protein
VESPVIQIVIREGQQEGKGEVVKTTPSDNGYERVKRGINIEPVTIYQPQSFLYVP